MWGLRLVRTLLSLSETIERLSRLWLSVCALASRRHGGWKLASGSHNIRITQTLHTTSKTNYVRQQWPTVWRNPQGQSEFSKSIRSWRHWILCKCLKRKPKWQCQKGLRWRPLDVCWYPQPLKKTINHPSTLKCGLMCRICKDLWSFVIDCESTRLAQSCQHDTAFDGGLICKLNFNATHVPSSASQTRQNFHLPEKLILSSLAFQFQLFIPKTS